jgi:hypothetical protein
LSGPNIENPFPEESCFGVSAHQGHEALAGGFSDG